MGMLDYRDANAKELMQNVMALNCAMYGPMGLLDGMEGNFESYNVNNAWRLLKPLDFNYSGTGYSGTDGSYSGESFLDWGAQVSVLGKYDENNKLTSVGLSFWGTGSSTTDENVFWNTLSDVLSYGLDILGPPDSIHSYVYNAFNNLLTDLAGFAMENGLTGNDIIVTGHSQGGLCVNSMASASALGKWNSFYEDAAYVAIASPTQNNLDDKVLNIGLENDPIFRVTQNDSLTLESLFVHDTPLPTCTNNVVSFNDYYTTDAFYSILNVGYWENGHGPIWYERAINTIVNSEFYSATNLNSTVIIAHLSDEMRQKTWVEDLNYMAQKHAGPTFILGSEQADLIKGGAGIDYLEGNGGDDIFRDDGGYNVIFGGDGIDTFDTGTQFDFWSYGKDLYGNIWAKDLKGNISILKDVEQIKGGFLNWFSWHEINGTFTQNGIEFSYDNVHDFKAYSATSNADLALDSTVIANAPSAKETGFLFGYQGNDTLIGTLYDEVFAPGDGDDIIQNCNGKDTIIVAGDSFGHDLVYGFGGDDKLVFLANSLIEDQNSLWQYMSTAGDDLIFKFNEQSSITLTGIAHLGLDESHFIAA